MTTGSEQRRLAAIMFTDMVGYSALSQRNENLAIELLEEHRVLLRSLFPRFHGTEIKTIGDAFLVEFHSALEAAQCAIEIQRGLAKRNHDVTEERRIEIKIGIHIGDVVHRDGDVYGDGVNIASRIEPLAGAGGICISMDVERQIRSKLEASLEKLAPTELKNISVAMDLFRIILPWDKPAQAQRGERQHGSMNKPHRIPPIRLIWITVVLLVVSLVGGWFVHQNSQSAKKNESLSNASSTAPVLSNATSSVDRKSVAVLPFVNMSSDKNDEYLSDGMTEELLNVLAKVSGLRVPGRSSCFSFKGKNEEGIFRKVGDQLNVSTVLEGSVRKAGNQLRITAQLINVADGFHLWSETYDRDMTNIFSIQSDVAQKVTAALKLKLGIEESLALVKMPTENMEAYQLYLLGRFNLQKLTEAGWSNAIRSFSQAIQLDPGYASAYCGLSYTYSFMGGYVMPAKEAFAKANEMALKAVALDPNFAEARNALAGSLHQMFDWEGAEREFKRALELNPKYPTVYDGYAFLAMTLGRTAEAISMAKRGLELDPLDLVIHNDLAGIFNNARRFDEAIAQAGKSFELDPNQATLRSMLGWSLIWQGRTAAAIPELQKGMELDPSPWSRSSLGYAYAISGERAKAENILRELEELAKHRYVSPSVRVVMYLGLGQKDMALDWLEKCYQEQDPSCWYLKGDKLYDSVRNEPRFLAIVKKMRLDK